MPPVQDAKQKRVARCSVVIPWGGKQRHFLLEQLEALAAQSTDDLEVIVVANSVSPREVERLADAAPPKLALRLVNANHCRGPSYARNVGVHEASGELLLFCDADDRVSENWVKVARGQLDDADVVAGHLVVGPLNAWARNARELPMEPKWGFLPCGATANLAVRRSVMDAGLLFDQSLAAAEDTDFCWRAQVYGFRFKSSHELLVHYRLRSRLSAIVRQHYSYGLSDALLMQRYASLGARRQLIESISDLGRLIIKTSYPVRWVLDWRGIVGQWANFLGRIVGSLRYRQWVV